MKHETSCDTSCHIIRLDCNIKDYYCDDCLKKFNTGEYWSTYILVCFDGSLYTGATNRLDKRIDKHNKGIGAKYTKARRPVKLLRKFLCTSKSAALKLEFKIKQLSHNEKLFFNPDLV